MCLSDQEMVDLPGCENESYEVHLEGNGRIELERALPKNWGPHRTLKGQENGLVVMGDLLPVKISEDFRNTR